MQGAIRNIVLNVRQQIFVCRDSKSGQSVLPLNFKGAAIIEIGKSGDCSFLSFDVAIASDAREMASDNQNDTRSKQNDRDLSHEKYVVLVRSEEHTSELQSLRHLVCRLLLEKKKKKYQKIINYTKK